MTKRKNFSSGAKWEDIVGYSRAVQIGKQLEISGTVAVDEKGLVGKGDMYAQTKFIIGKLKGVLELAGYSMEDVIRTRIYVTDISKWEQVGKAHGEFFSKIKPVTSMVEVSGLIDPDFLVEIEVSAVKE